MRAVVESSAVVAVWRRAATDSVALRALRHVRVPADRVVSVFERAAHDEGRLTRWLRVANAVSSSVAVASLREIRRAPVRAWETSVSYERLQRIRREWNVVASSQRLRLLGITLALAASLHAVLLLAARWIVGWSNWVLIASVGVIGVTLALGAQAFAAAAQTRRGSPRDVRPAAIALDARWTRAACAVGVLLAVAYTLSPLGVAFVATIGVITWRASINMPPPERRRFITILCVAAVIRIALVAILPYTVDPQQESFRSLFGDAVYAIQRSTWIRNVLLGVPVAPLQAFEAFHPVYGYTGYHYVLAYLQVLFGPAPYGLHLFSAALLLIGAILLHLEVRRSFGARTALIALGIILFLPSLLIWSIAPLKESMSFFLMALAVVGVVRSARGPGWQRRLAAAVLAALALAGVQTLRAGALAIAGGGVAIGLLLWAMTIKKRIAVAVLALALVSVLYAVRQPAIEQQFLDVTRLAARRHLGHVLTRGSSYQALEPEFYINRSLDTMTMEETMEFLARSIVAFIVEPTPWRDGTPTERLLVPQQLVWYALVLFAVLGIVAGMRRNRLLTCLLLGTAVAGVLVIAPNSGNIGTLVRHRDMIVPFVVPLGVLGATRVLARSPEV